MFGLEFQRGGRQKREERDGEERERIGERGELSGVAPVGGLQRL